MRRGLLAALARGFRALPPREVPAWLDLRRSEKVRANIAAVRLIEVTEWHGLRRPGYAEFTAAPTPVEFERDLPDQARVVDRGSVVITDQRVAFGGSYYRQDWLYSRLLGLAHEVEAPCTLMRVTDRTKVSGLVVAAAAAPAFRVNLTQAIADAMGDEPGSTVSVMGGGPERRQRRAMPSHRLGTRPPQVTRRPRHRRSPVEA